MQRGLGTLNSEQYAALFARRPGSECFLVCCRTLAIAARRICIGRCDATLHVVRRVFLGSEALRRALRPSGLTMRTRAQHRVTRSLHRLGDDPLQKVLSYLSVGECLCGPGSVSKSLLAMAASASLKRTRGLESYTLRGDEHGIVHALATSCGTKLWPTRLVQRQEYRDPLRTVALPPGVTYRISRVKHGEASIDDETYGRGHPPLMKKLHGLFEADLDPNKDDTLSTGSD